ncbi:MAG TPA: DNA polymerase III subunit beta [Methylophilus sp.]|nr:DNA polymerase III subunit beta [Methylophilus sp.]HQQ32321.1 DNA polymerase III subunit beta [Methylophilus sp.]
MQITINREILLKPLGHVASIVERRHTLPILSNLLVEVSNQAFKLTATDLEMQISLAISNHFKEAFATTISAKKFLDICRSLPESSEINLQTSDSRMTVKAGKSRFNLQTLPAADYPLMAKASGSFTQVKVSQNALKKCLRQVEFAMAQQDIRYYLNGLLLEINGDRLNFVGTDGHRLSFTSMQLVQSYEKAEVIVPRKTVIELVKLLEDNDEDIIIEISSSQINFTFGEINLISKVIDGKFPDYNRVIPQGHRNSFTVDRLQILTAMQRASILSNEKYRGIRLDIHPNLLRLVSTNTEQEEAEEELEISYSGEAIDVGFNVTYLIDVLNNIQHNEVTFALADANSSCLITNPADADYKYVVMPMRI